MAEREKEEKILRRITTEHGMADVVEVLSEKLEPTDLQSLLLEVYGKRARRIGIKDILRQYRENRFLSPCDLDQRKLAAFDHLLYSLLPENFEAVELSPLMPFGTNWVLSGINQKNVSTTVRNIEVLADATTALALVCTERRMAALSQDPLSAHPVNIATSQRTIRLQRFDAIRGFTPHFRVFALASAGRDVGFEKFEMENLQSHIRFYLRALEALTSREYFAKGITVTLSDIRIAEAIIKEYGADRREVRRNTQNASYNLFVNFEVAIPVILSGSAKETDSAEIEKFGIKKNIELLVKVKDLAISPLQVSFPKAQFEFDLARIAGIGHYEGLCFKISATTKAGETLPLVDGGMVNWTKRLVSSRKERLLVSGAGSELFCRNFKA